MVERLFVYGSLRPGRENAQLLAPIPGSWARGRVRGHLAEEGWGATLGYPALTPDEQGEWIEGDLLSSASLGAHWERIDRFEGPGYARVLCAVALEDGSVVEAFVYALRS